MTNYQRKKLNELLSFFNDLEDKKEFVAWYKTNADDLAVKEDRGGNNKKVYTPIIFDEEDLYEALEEEQFVNTSEYYQVIAQTETAEEIRAEILSIYAAKNIEEVIREIGLDHVDIKTYFNADDDDDYSDGWWLVENGEFYQYPTRLARLNSQNNVKYQVGAIKTQANIDIYSLYCQKRG